MNQQRQHANANANAPIYYEEGDNDYDLVLQVLQGIHQEIRELKNVVEEQGRQVDHNQREIMELRKQVISIATSTSRKNENEILAKSQNYLKNELSTLEDKIIAKLTARSTRSSGGDTTNRRTCTSDNYNHNHNHNELLQLDEEEVQGGPGGDGETRVFEFDRTRKKYHPFTNNKQRGGGNFNSNDKQNASNLDQITSVSSTSSSSSSSTISSTLSSSDPYKFWSRGPQTLLSFSYAFRLAYAICFAFISFDRELMYDGTSSSYTIIEKPLCSTFLFLSVICSFEAYRKRGIVSLVGWIILAAGAIVYIIAGRDSFFRMKTTEIVYNVRAAFALLAAGHTVELLHTVYHASSSRIKRISIIVKAICPPCFAIAAYMLPLTVDYGMGYGFGVQGVLLICHAFAQYVTLFCMTPPPKTSFEQNDINQKNGKQPNMKPEPIHDMFDSYTLMMTSSNAAVWNFGFLIYFIQAGLSIMIIAEQFVRKETLVPLDAPSKIVNLMVVFSQFAALLLAIFRQTDILTSVRMLTMLWYGRDESWPYDKIYAKNGKFWTWVDKVLLPNMLRLLSGLLVLGTSFVIIVKCDNALDLFKDFTGRKVRWNPPTF